MDEQKRYSFIKSDYLKLVPILALAFYLAFLPHHSYSYLVHLDEWNALAFSNEIIKQASVTGLTNPFLGGAPMWNQTVEVGFHLFWAVFHQISGLPWLDIFRYFPGIVFIITVLSAYVLAQREGFGWEAALFTCLITTTVGILGPGFLIPVAMGLLFIPLSIFLAFNLRTGWSYLVLFIFMCFLFSLHAATAVGLIIILVPYILLNLKGSFRHSLGITLALGLPFLIALPWISGLVLSVANRLFSQQPLPTYVDLPRIIYTYGYLPVLFCLLGTFLLAIRGEKKSYGLVFGLLALLLMLVAFFTFHYGESLMYYRGLIYLMLVMSVVAGAGLMAIRKMRLPSKLARGVKSTFLTKNIGNILCLILIGLTLAMCIPVRQHHIPYYHMINREDYQVFVWIKENVDSSYSKAILDPWKATAFTAITGKHVYTKIGAYPTATDIEAYNFLDGDCKDTAFMRSNGISIVYTRGSCSNLDLVEQEMEHVYLLKEGGTQ